MKVTVFVLVAAGLVELILCDGPSEYLPPTSGFPSSGNGGYNGASRPSGPGFGSTSGSGASSSGYGSTGGGGGNGDGGDGKPEPFSFSYEVKDAESGNDYSHRAESDGSRVTGEYQVLLPDGRRQTVSYTADQSGYNADVKYDGEASPGGPGGAGGPGGPGGPGGSGYPGSGSSFPTGGSNGYPAAGRPSGQGFPTGGGGGGYPSSGPSPNYLPPGK